MQQSPASQSPSPASSRFGTAVKTRIEQLTARVLEENRFLRKLTHGQPLDEEISSYLHNLGQVLAATPAHLAAVSRGAVQLGLPSLEAFAREKLVEEVGHDEWAKADLRTFPEVRGLSLTRESSELIGSVFALIARDPRLYLAYATFAEYFTVIAGPVLLEAMNRRQGIAPDRLTVIRNHQDADADHYLENLELIESFGFSPSEEAGFLAAVDASAEWIGRTLESFEKRPC